MTLLQFPRLRLSHCFLCCAFIACTAFSQPSLFENTRLWAVGTQNGVALQWTLPQNQTLPLSYTILRSPSAKNRFQIIGKTSRLRSDEWKTLRLHVQPDSLHAAINMASSDRARPEERNAACLKLATMAISEPSAYVLVLGLSFSDTSCKFSMAYDYRVCAGGQILAEVNDVWPGKSYAPSAPSFVRAKPDVGCIHFVWSTDSAVLQGIRGCNIYRRSPHDAAFTKVNKTVALSLIQSNNRNAFTFFDDCGLIPQLDYEYALSSVDIFGRESARSSILTVRPLSKGSANRYAAPRITHTELSENRIRVHWSIENDSSIAGFNLYRSSFGGPNKQKVNREPIASDVRSYNDLLGDVPANYISYSISTVDPTGSEGTMSYEFRSPVIDHTSPLNADYIECSRSGGVVHLRWSSTDSRDVQGYELERAFRSEGPYQAVMELSNQSSFDDSVQAFASQSLWYRIRSVDLRGNYSPWSEPVHAFSSLMKTIVPPTPMAGNPQIRCISISWFPSTSPEVSGYLINRYDDTTSAPRTLTLKPLPATSSEFVDSTVVPLKTYWYELVCTDSTGDLSQPSQRVQQRAMLSRATSRSLKEWYYLRQRNGK